MTTGWISRNVHEPGGFGYILRKAKGLAPIQIPRDVAGWAVDVGGRHHAVTWSEIHAQRRERQKLILQSIRSQRRDWPRPAQLWAFDNGDQFPFGGWYLYIRYRDGDRIGYLSGGGAKGDVREGSILATHLRTIIPLVLPTEPWSEWMRAFAKACPKRKAPRDPRPAGILNGWTDGRSFYLTRDAAAQARH